MAFLIISDPSSLGPPPRHAGPTDVCKYLGFAGVDAGVRLYCETARDLFLEYQGRASLAEAPLIVNTMGWTTGSIMPLWRINDN